MPETKLVVRASEQCAELWRDGSLERRYRVSTGARGLGCEEGSHKTPTGRFRVAEKHGHGAPIGSVFRGRRATGECWADDPANALRASGDDLILTRILWLEGCEAHNANTRARYIYLHGTNQEHLLGTPASHGCVRFSNRDIAEVFEMLAEGSPVEILA